MSRERHFEYGFLAELLQCLQIKLEEGLVGLTILYRRVFRRKPFESVQREEYLRLQGLFAP